MKIKLLIFLLIICSKTAICQSGTFLERAKLGLKSGNTQKLIQLIGEKVQFGMEGEGSMVSRKVAESKLNNFFQTSAPQEIAQLFQGQSKDGKQYFIGRLTTKKGDFRVSIYWTESPVNQMISIDISKE